MTAPLTEAEVERLRALAAPPVSRSPGGARLVPMTVPARSARNMTKAEMESMIYSAVPCGWCGVRLAPTQVADRMAPVGRRGPQAGIEFSVCESCADPVMRASSLYDAVLAGVGRVGVDPADLLAALIELGACWSGFASTKSLGGVRSWSFLRDLGALVAAAERVAVERERRRLNSVCVACGRGGLDQFASSPQGRPAAWRDDRPVCLACHEAGQPRRLPAAEG